MSAPKISVIIPAFNGSAFLPDAIQSVLKQTYQNFELIIVDDASQDNTQEVVKQYADPRLKYVLQPVNQGPDAARRVAIQMASGDILMPLDQDDAFHPEKFALHVALLEKHPELDFTYNSRFELNHSAKTVREIWRPPQAITLADLVLGFPISPSDMVLRRKWADYLDLSKEPALIHGGEYVVTGRLFMSGCRFGSIDRALNYRAYHAQRRFSKIPARCASELSAQQRVFDDPRCPAAVLALRDVAFMNTYRIWAYYALAQEETATGQAYLRQAITLQPALINGHPSELVEFLMVESTADESVNHEVLLKTIFAQLPAELMPLAQQYHWAVGRGYLLRGVRAIIWGRVKEGQQYFQQAAQWQAQLDERFFQLIAYHLLNYEKEFGADATKVVMQNLARCLEKSAKRADARFLKSSYAAGQAFSRYKAGEYPSVPKNVVQAIASNPRYLTNRGLLSILVRSLTSA